MPVQYYFDNLDPASFQRLINALLVARYGEKIRLLPLRGTDGGRDAETAPGALFELEIGNALAKNSKRVELGRYVFQVKHHRTTDRPGSAIRAAVISDFETELSSNIVRRELQDKVDYFYLITNVASSKESISKIDEKRQEIFASYPDLCADVLWQEHIVSWLDQLPTIWLAFPEIFAGMKVPLLGQVAGDAAQGLAGSVRLALKSQMARDGMIRFRQVSLERSLSRLFVDLEANTSGLSRPVIQSVVRSGGPELSAAELLYGDHRNGISCLGVLLSEVSSSQQKLILEGGPGQGKSTITQMLAQVYRALLMQNGNEYAEFSSRISKARFPFRIELRLFAEWLSSTDRSVEQYIAESFTKDAGGADIDVAKIHQIVQDQPVFLIFDGLDEVGSDELRDAVIDKIRQCIERFEQHLSADLRVVITSRPPAIAGRINRLSDFTRVQLMPLSDQRVADYVEHWTDAQCSDLFDKERVVDSFNKRKSEEHVHALVKNPMQLSVLLHFIRLKGEAFPDRRAELYREYFKTVIDRDVEKSPQLRANRDHIEALHEVIGFEIHSRAELDSAKASLSHEELLDIVQQWLLKQGRKKELAPELFRIGQERLGLVVVLKGDGEDARYGFEVQPVREYFAAAFINDKCEGNAHDYFQSMVRRPFWREVALFLAGLRRANEKADLLSRARALDDEQENGWRSDGLRIVLQLLQEGVLTTPGHVHQDALSFLVESLDPSIRQARNEPRELLTALPALICSSDNAHVRSTLEALLSKCDDTRDRYALYRLYTVANRVLSDTELQEHIARFKDTDGLLSSMVRLYWPAMARKSLITDMCQLSGSLIGLQCGFNRHFSSHH